MAVQAYQDSIKALSRRVSAVLGDHSLFSITFARHVASNRCYDEANRNLSQPSAG